MQRTCLTAFCLIWLAAMMAPALAGPPYQSDDPEPTDYKHFEIYTFVDGTAGHDGASGESGVDFNYGAAPNLQLTAVIPAPMISVPVRLLPVSATSNWPPNIAS